MLRGFSREAFVVDHYALAGLYGFVMLLSIAALVRLYFASKLEFRWQKFFHPLMITGLFIRMFFFILQPLIMTHQLHISNGVNTIINLLPSFLFFSDYMIVLFLWAEIYHFESSPKGLKKLRAVFWIITILMYGALLALFILELTITKRVYTNALMVENPVEKSLMIYLAVIYITTCVGFILYGGLIIWRISKMSPILIGGSNISPIRRRLLYRIIAITAVVSLSFIVRGILSILTLWVHFSAGSYWFDPVYFILLELLPLLLMIWLLHRGKKRRAQAHHSIQDSSIAGEEHSGSEEANRAIYRENDILYVGDAEDVYGSTDNEKQHSLASVDERMV